ncbi:MAG: hypothetical protein ISS28_02105, partial [Candidatus Cloacimonetes bacterium]|nr:hypothetical protein [Candidatus Cloacimonadota bacterium]
VPDLCISIGLRSGKTFEYIGSTGRLKIPQEKFTRGTKGKVTIELQNIILNPGEYPLYFGLMGVNTKAYDIIDDLTLPLSIKENISIDNQDYMKTSSGFFTFDSKLI